MKRLKSSKTSIDLPLKDCSPEAVRYAAYAVSGAAYVFLGPRPGGKLRVELEPKPGASGALPRRFLRELEDEKLRERISSANTELREFLLLKGLNYQPKAPVQDDSGLTPQQEKELNDLISQIEGEIKAEASSASADPLGITSTWEEKYDAKNSRKKSR